MKENEKNEGQQLKGEVVKKYKAAVYCRLSKEDRKYLESISESIENQVLVIQEYAKGRGELEIVDTYIDDGFTGMNYERKEFIRMMGDVAVGKINTIITKDLSRLGREQINTLMLVTREFIENSIRYIAVNDGYDSFLSSDTTMIEMRAFMNNFYSADNSKKIRSIQKAKRENGEFIGAFAPYGYLKEEKDHNKLMVDPQTAPVVEQIFNLYLNGCGKQAIARLLNEEGVPSPTIYKQKVLGLSYQNKQKLESTTYWTYSTICRILTHEVYIGNLVQHVQEKISYRSKKRRILPKQEQCIIESTHPPIIEKDKFDIAQKMLQTKRRELKITENVTLYAGLFFCGDCKRRMSKFLNRPLQDGTRTAQFKCSTYSNYGKSYCKIHSIKEETLNQIIIAQIRENAIHYLSEKDYEKIEELASREKERNGDMQLDHLKKDQDKMSKRLDNMLLKFSEDVITKEEFRQFKETNNNEIQAIESKIKNLEEKNRKAADYLGKQQSWVIHLVESHEIAKLTREMLVNLVERIEIFEDNRVEICFRFQKPTP